MAKKLSRAEKIRRYLKANPDMALKDVAAHFDTTYQVVYMVRQTMRKREKFWAENGLPPAMTPMPELKPTKEYSYAWIDTNQLDEIAKDALAAQLAPIEQDMVNHPAHYKTGGIETIDFIEAKELNYNMGNAVKYISRADHKGDKKQDLEKAVWYLNREIAKA
jgi:Protein of unknwon function (DUF3310)